MLLAVGCTHTRRFILLVLVGHSRQAPGIIAPFEEIMNEHFCATTMGELYSLTRLNVMTINSFFVVTV